MISWKDDVGLICFIINCISFAENQPDKFFNETPRSKLRGISTKDISNNNAASSGVFTLRENKIFFKGRNLETKFLDFILR